MITKHPSEAVLRLTIVKLAVGFRSHNYRLTNRFCGKIRHPGQITGNTEVTLDLWVYNLAS